MLVCVEMLRLIRTKVKNYKDCIGQVGSRDRGSLELVCRWSNFKLLCKSPYIFQAHLLCFFLIVCF